MKDALLRDIPTGVAVLLMDLEDSLVFSENQAKVAETLLGLTSAPEGSAEVTLVELTVTHIKVEFMDDGSLAVHTFMCGGVLFSLTAFRIKDEHAGYTYRLVPNPITRWYVNILG